MPFLFVNLMDDCTNLRHDISDAVRQALDANAVRRFSLIDVNLHAVFVFQNKNARDLHNNRVNTRVCSINYSVVAIQHKKKLKQTEGELNHASKKSMHYA